MDLVAYKLESIWIRYCLDCIAYGSETLTKLNWNLAEDIGKPTLRVEESVGTVFWLRTSENRIQNNLCKDPNLVIMSRLESA